VVSSDWSTPHRPRSLAQISHALPRYYIKLRSWRNRHNAFLLVVGLVVSRSRSLSLYYRKMTEEDEKAPMPALVRQDATMDLAAMDSTSFDATTEAVLRSAIRIFQDHGKFEEARILQLLLNGGFYDPNDIVRLPPAGPEDNWSAYSCCSC
jgi:hypothetical protein